MTVKKKPVLKARGGREILYLQFGDDVEGVVKLVPVVSVEKGHEIEEEEKGRSGVLGGSVAHG